MSPDYGLKVAEDFQKYLRTGENQIIERYSSRELKTAVSRLSPYYNHNKLWFRAVERRIEELDHRIEAQRERNRWSFSDKRISADVWVAFVIGLLCGLFIQLF